MLDRFLINVSRFLENEPFFAMVSLNISKKVDKTLKQAINISFNKEDCEFCISYNPNIINKNTPAEHFIMYKHELYHFILEHLTLRWDDKVDLNKWNICADLAINGLPDMIDMMSKLTLTFPDGTTSGVFVPGFGEAKNIPPCKTLEWYLNNINDNFFSKFKQENLFDVVQPIKDETIKALYNAEKMRIFKKAVEECNKRNNWGSCPLNIREQLIKTIERYIISPEEVLKRFIVRSITFSRKNYFMRKNRRTNEKIGKVKEKCAKFAVCIDESGSISSDLLSKFVKFMESMSNICSFIVVPFDSAVNKANIFEWKKGQKLDYKRKKCGGTSFDAPAEYVNENKFDGCLVLTDGEGQHTIPSKCRRVFVLPKNASFYEKNLMSKFNDQVVILEREVMNK